MAPRNFVQASAVIPESAIFEFLQFSQNRALAGSVQVVPVVHGGEKANGELHAALGTDEFVSAQLAEHGRIDTKTVVPLAAKMGLSKASIYARLKKMMEDKLIKRVDTGAYVPATRKSPTKKSKSKAAKAAKFNPKPGQSVSELLVKFVGQKQNGSGEGVSLSALKDAVEKKGFAPTGVGPALTNLVAKKKLTRVGFGEYRLPKNAEG